MGRAASNSMTGSSGWRRGARNTACEGGDVNASTEVVESVARERRRDRDGQEHVRRRGPLGRGAHGAAGGATSPPFHTPVFIVTHHPREPVVKQGGTDVHLRHRRHRVRARAGPGSGRRQGRRSWPVARTSPSSIWRQGLIDELQLHVVPVLLGAGARLFDNLGDVDRRARVHERRRGPRRRASHLPGRELRPASGRSSGTSARRAARRPRAARRSRGSRAGSSARPGSPT